MMLHASVHLCLNIIFIYVVSLLVLTCSFLLNRVFCAHMASITDTQPIYWVAEPSLYNFFFCDRDGMLNFKYHANRRQEKTRVKS